MMAKLFLDQQFGGCIHVDDGLVGSGIWCVDSIFAIIQKKFPPDVGLEMEESGRVIKFLNGIVVFG